MESNDPKSAIAGGNVFSVMRRSFIIDHIHGWQEANRKDDVEEEEQKQRKMHK